MTSPSEVQRQTGPNHPTLTCGRPQGNHPGRPQLESTGSEAVQPPRQKRGRPGLDSVTAAIRLRRTFGKQRPGERPAQIWQRIYPEAIPGYAGMSAVQQGGAHEQLRERVRWRQRRRRPRSAPRAWLVSICSIENRPEPFMRITFWAIRSAPMKSRRNLGGLCSSEK